MRQKADGLIRGSAWRLWIALAVVCVSNIVPESRGDDAPQPAQDATRAASLRPEAKKRSASIVGIVCRADSQPVAGATVLLKEFAASWYQDPLNDVCESAPDDVPGSTTTDATGKFTFQNVPLQPWPKCPDGKCYPEIAVVVQAKGYGVAWKKLSPTSVDAGKIVVGTASPLRGRVVSAAGQPVAGVRLTVTDIEPLLVEEVERKSAGLDLQRSKIVYTTNTDGAGRFQIDGLSAEKLVVLRADHPDFARWLFHGAITNAPQPKIKFPIPGNFYGQTQLLPVPTGEITATLPAGHVAAGRITYADTGKPCHNMHVALRKFAGSSSHNIFCATTDADGRYRIANVVEGELFHLSLETPDTSPYLSPSVPITPKVATTVVDVALLRGIPQTGTVVDETTGRGLAGVNLMFTSDIHEWDSPPDKPKPVWSVHAVQTNDQGQFTILLPPAVGTISLHGHVPGYLLPTAEFGVDPNPRWFRNVKITSGKAVAPLKFLLDRGLTIRGRVLTADGKPVAGAHVLECSSGGNSGPTQPQAVSDATGAYTLTGVSDQPIVWLLSWHEARKLKAMTRVPAAKKGERRKEAACDISLQAIASVKFHLTSQGKPAPQAYMQITEWISSVSNLPQFEGQERQSTRGLQEDYYELSSDGSVVNKPLPLASLPERAATGSGTIHNLIPGWHYAISFGGRGHYDRDVDLKDLKPGENRDLGTFDLPPTRTVTITVVGPDGKPVSGINVTVREPSPPADEGRSRGTPFSDDQGQIVLREVLDLPVKITPSSYMNQQNGTFQRLKGEAEVTLPAGKSAVRIVVKARPGKR